MTPVANPPETAALRRRALRTLFWCLAASLLFNLLFGDLGVIQGIRQRRTAARLQGEVAALQARNQRLAAAIDGLRHDSYRIEAIAREELGLRRPGEITFLFTSSHSPAAQ